MADVTLTLDVEKPAAGGRMLARHNGQIVLVWGAIPGERVRARVERTGKGVLYAETIEVLTASADRREPAGDWRCGGNVFAHVAYPRQLLLKSDIIRDAFARIGRTPLADAPVVAGSPEQGYRMRARLHVRDGRIGFMREGSHQLCPAGPSGQLLPATVAWIDAATERIQRDRLTGLSSIEIAENIPASERACHLELEPGADAAPFAVLAAEGTESTGSVTGLSAQVADRRTVEQLSGVATVTDTLQLTPAGAGAATDAGNTLRLQRDARAFFQGNRFLLEAFVRHVIALVPAGPVIDLYAGVGLFGLSLAATGAADVRLVEGDMIAAHDLKENARPYAGRVRVHRASVEEFLIEMDAAGSAPAGATFLVDPPRTGLSKQAIAGLVRMQPKRIVYVSCDVATLARDARTLIDAGYTLEGMRGFDLFPNTAHVETVCAFSL